ncbi:ABC transporter ATP-binding protein [Leucobacter sp. GX24907]
MTAHDVAVEVPLIRAEGVVRRFGGFTAVDIPYLEVPRGKISALIGPNGAGKTTLFNLLTGFDTPNAGKWSFNGQPLQGKHAYQIARLGMVRTFQLTKVLGKVTVLQNMLLGSRQRGERLDQALLRPLWIAEHREYLQRARELLARFGLEAKQDDYAASLSGGQRKLLEMARALMARPKLLMLDEPMAGVNPALTQTLVEHIMRLPEEGIEVLFVEHDMHVVKRMAGHVVVMADGKLVAQGTPHETLTDQAVVDAYLGTHHDVDLRDVIAQRQARRTPGAQS